MKFKVFYQTRSGDWAHVATVHADRAFNYMRTLAKTGGKFRAIKQGASDASKTI